MFIPLPRARGERNPYFALFCAIGSSTARAGRTVRRRGFEEQVDLLYRARGENGPGRSAARRRSSPLPRARGERVVGVHGAQRVESSTARGGRTGRPRDRGACRRFLYRARGENGSTGTRWRHMFIPLPRARGRTALRSRRASPMPLLYRARGENGPSPRSRGMSSFPLPRAGGERAVPEIEGHVVVSSTARAGRTGRPAPGGGTCSFLYRARGRTALRSRRASPMPLLYRARGENGPSPRSRGMSSFPLPRARGERFGGGASRNRSTSSTARAGRTGSRRPRCPAR